jgi:hypothetical protein
MIGQFLKAYYAAGELHYLPLLLLTLKQLNQGGMNGYDR